LKSIIVAEFSATALRPLFSPEGIHRNGDAALNKALPNKTTSISPETAGGQNVFGSVLPRAWMIQLR
jgi:hypothetical protein